MELLSITELIGAYKSVASPIIATGFVLAGIGTVRLMLQHPERAAKPVITYIVALMIYIAIWQMI